MSRYSKILKSKKGFTLLEVIVSLFIIVVLSGVFLTNYRSGDYINRLILAAQKVESDFRQAQNLSLGTVREGGMPPPEGGWGLQFDMSLKNGYLTFDDSSSNMYIGDSPSDWALIFGQDFHSLPDGVEIDDLIADGTSRSMLAITFSPPDPIIHIFDSVSWSTSTSATVRLKEIHTGKVKNINVNLFGMLEVTN